MPYNAGGPSMGSSFGAIGPKLNANVASFQQGNDELLRKFYASLMAQQGSPFQAATVPKAGAFLNPDLSLTGIDDPGGGAIPPGGGMSIAPQLQGGGQQQYVKNAGVNALLNSINKPAGAGGGAGKWAAALGGL